MQMVRAAVPGATTDEVPQMPQFDVHRERNPNRHAITATVDTIASREA
jgi:hypothetical protein